MARPEIGQSGWGEVLNDDLSQIEASAAAAQAAADAAAAAAAAAQATATAAQTTAGTAVQPGALGIQIEDVIIEGDPVPPPGIYLVRPAPDPASIPTVVAAFPSAGNVLTSGAVTITQSAAVGDVVQVCVAAGGALADDAVSVSDSNGHVWVLREAQSTSGTASTVYVFETTVDELLEAGVDTITVNRTTTGGLAWGAHKISNTTAPADEAQLGFNATAQTSASTAAVDAAANSLVVMAVSLSSVATDVAAGAGYTLLHTVVSTGSGNPRQLAVVYRQLAAAGATTPSLSWTGSSGWAAVATEMGAA